MIATRPSLRRAVVSLLATLALALAFGAPARAATTSGPCAAAPAPGTSAISVTSGGLKRSALVHVPAGLPAGTRVPLLLALHGAYGNAATMESYSGFSSLADSHDFIVAYPNAVGSFWNIGAVANEANDVAFIRSLIGTLEANLCLDSTRVFAAGVSNGAGMVALLGCELSTQLAGIAPVAGDYDKLPSCHLKRPVPLLEIHGTSDPVAPYRGRRGQATVDGVPPFVSAWALRDGCAGLPATRHIATRTVMFRWKRCAGAASVEHIRIIAGRHQWPGATPPDPGPAATICASCTIWSFFSGLGSTSAPPVTAPPTTLPPSGGAEP
ncbi:MAG TPA: PHB depolymerase family esterase [Solirubrobacteraceae bacterium]|jgi:polyhydroxybutyrate depolymerase|nr:PHB depolymerase family esterase [Solirubrobacteraceae bacterium]